MGWSATRIGGLGPRGLDYNFGFVARTALALPAGSYRFTVKMNDGAKFYVDNRRVIDSWRIYVRTTTESADVDLAAGTHSLRLDYMQDQNVARISLWAEPLDPRASRVLALAFDSPGRPNP